MVKDMNLTWIVLVFIKMYVCYIKSDIYIIKFLPSCLTYFSKITRLGGWHYSTDFFGFTLQSLYIHIQNICKH
jgi:hypothetical protein